MHSFEEIIKNQKAFKEDIFLFFLNEYADLKKNVNDINSNDKFIINEKNKIKKIIEKLKPKTCIEHLFFLSKNRDKTFYAWWDQEEKEAKILKYDKR